MIILVCKKLSTRNVKIRTTIFLLSIFTNKNGFLKESIRKKADRIYTNYDISKFYKIISIHEYQKNMHNFPFFGLYCPI